MPDLTNAIPVETEFGVLYLPSEDEMITAHVRAHHSWDSGETAFLADVIRPGMTFLDIGAHVGYFSVMAARLVGHRGLVLAFEPEPRNYSLLLANVWENGLGNVVCFPWAVGEHSGFARLYTGGTNTGDNRLYASEEEREAMLVRVVALDSIAALRPPVNVIKIDVQGAEDAVIRGMHHLLAASPDVVVLAEYWPYGIRQRGEDARSILDYYRSLGYRIRVQHPEHVGVTELTDDEILDYCRGQDGFLHTNVVLTKR
jgi:FkbM family methyltransferase